MDKTRIPGLKVGSVYAVHHTRKGYFKAQLVDLIKAQEGDAQDAVFLRMKIDTRRGTGQERLARAPVDVTVTDVRPSLVMEIEPIKDADFLVRIRVPEEQAAKQLAYPAESLTDKVRRSIRELFRR